MTKLTAKSRDGLSAEKFAFPAQRKEPLKEAGYVRIAIAHFNEVEGITHSECDTAWAVRQSSRLLNWPERDARYDYPDVPQSLLWAVAQTVFWPSRNLPTAIGADLAAHRFLCVLPAPARPVVRHWGLITLKRKSS